MDTLKKIMDWYAKHPMGIFLITSVMCISTLVASLVLLRSGFNFSVGYRTYMPLIVACVQIVSTFSVLAAKEFLPERK